MSLPAIFFERLIDVSPDIIIAADCKGRITFYNDGAERTLGYDSSELLGRHVLTLYPSVDSARTMMKTMRSGETDQPGCVKNFETEIFAKSGEKIPIAVSGAIIHDESGAEVGSVGFIKDLREIRRRRELATAGELAVSLSHEINNPLESIANNLDLLSHFVEKRATDEEYVVEGDRLESICRDLARIQDTLDRVRTMVSSGKYGTRVYLPGCLMTDLRGETDEEATAEPQALAEGPVASNGLAGTRVLVVDDDLGICQSVRDLLVEEHCEVRTAKDGLEALRILESAPTDLVLSDVVMPDMDGHQLYKELQTRRPELPVVLMTAYNIDLAHVIKRSHLDGLEEKVVFKKPINPSKLKTILAEALKRSSAGRAARAAQD